MDRRSIAIRTHPLVFGVSMFLASELMLFAGFIAAYYQLRAVNSVWPPAGVHLDFVEDTIGTIVLFLSSATMLVAQKLWTRLNFKAARWTLLGTFALGCGFLIIAFHGYANATFHVSDNAYGSIYYLMTGVHAMHVTAGVILLAALIIGLRRPAFSARDFAGAEAISYYWHFVFIVWLGIYASIFLVR